MFNFFKSRKPEPPLNTELRQYFENNLLWLEFAFPKPTIKDRVILSPTEEYFPIEWDNSKESAIETAKIVAENMQIDINEVDMLFFENPEKEINMGTSTMFINTQEDSKEAAGKYHYKNENDKYEISLDLGLAKQPESLIATIAHEFAHLKLLGEAKMEYVDEMLTDLTTVFFGFGIFNANTAFQFHSSYDRWGYKTLGYLKEEEWAYALAIYSYLREETNPNWVEYLTKTLRKDFERSMDYILNNPNDLFKEPENTHS